MPDVQVMRWGELVVEQAIMMATIRRAMDEGRVAGGEAARDAGDAEFLIREVEEAIMAHRGVRQEIT